MPHVAWSASVCVLVTGELCKKRLNRSRCCLVLTYVGQTCPRNHVLHGVKFGRIHLQLRGGDRDDDAAFVPNYYGQQNI